MCRWVGLAAVGSPWLDTPRCRVFVLFAGVRRSGPTVAGDRGTIGERGGTPGVSPGGRKPNARTGTVP